MAGDTREPASTSNAAPSKAKTGSSGISLSPVTPQNANALPGGGLNTAGGKTAEAGIIDAAKTIHLSELKDVHKKPCVRDALMTGIGVGFGVGGVRSILGASIMRSCNWAVGTFCFGSFLMYEYCQRKRLLELQGMKRAVEVMERKQTEKQIKAEAARAAVRKAKEES